MFKNANESTFVHEMAHAYMDVLERLAQGGNAKAQKDLDKIRKWTQKKHLINQGVYRLMVGATGNLGLPKIRNCNS